MFPGPNANIYRNEVGEVLGWDYPAEPEYCDVCGVMHSSLCPGSYQDNDDWYDDDGAGNWHCLGSIPSCPLRSRPRGKEV
jgi:hypothetical protein